MTDAELIELFRKAKEGNKKAQNALHEHFDPLLRYYADKYSKRYSALLIEFDDLLQEAHIGLLKAVRNFNPEKATNGNMSITTYIYFYVLDELQTACDYDSMDLVGSIHGDNENDSANSIPDDLNIEEIILSQEIAEEDLVAKRTYLDNLISSYSPIDKTIIRMRLGTTTGVPRTLKEISSLLDMSIESIRKREREILIEIINHKVNFFRV